MEDNKKTIVREIKKDMQRALALLWDVEKNYNDIHHVMKILKDGSPIVKNPEGAMLTLAVERYFERHKDESEFNHVKMAIDDISQAKLKLVDLQEKLMIDESEQSQRVGILEKQYKQLRQSVDKIKKEIPSEIDVSIPVDQEMDIVLRPTPVREDLFKSRVGITRGLIDESRTTEQWDTMRGQIVGMVAGTPIRKNVLEQIKSYKEDGPRYALDHIMPKYYPKASRASHAKYVRAYYRHMNEKITLPDTWIQETPQISIVEQREPFKFEAIENIPALELHDELTRLLYEKYESRINTKNLGVLMRALIYHKEGLSRKQCVLLTEVNDNRTYTHLRYLTEKKLVTIERGNYRLTQEGIDYYQNLLKNYDIYEQQPSVEAKIEKPELPKETKRKKYIKGRRIPGKLAQKISETYNTTLVFQRYLKVLETVEHNPETKDSELTKLSGLPVSATYAHLRFGIESGDMEAKDRRYKLRSNGLETLKKLSEQFGKAKAEIKRVTPKPSKKGYHKIAEHFNEKFGEKIDDDISRKIEKSHHISIRKKMHQQVLEDLKAHPNAKAKEIAERINIAPVKLNAHLKYGIETGTIVTENARYVLIGEAKVPKAKPEEKPIETPKVTLEGTPIKDHDALYIHTTYGSPVIEERYTKIKNVLQSAVLFKQSVSQLAEHTSWSKHNVFIHLLYGMRKKEIVECGIEDGKKQYCLKQHLNKIIKPKEVKIRSKSWLKSDNEDKSESLWRKP